MKTTNTIKTAIKKETDKKIVVEPLEIKKKGKNDKSVIELTLF